MKLFCSLLTVLWAGVAAAQPTDAALDRLYPDLEALYYDLHANPELSFYEKETSAKMADVLRKAGFEVTEKVGGYGVVGVLRNGKGQTVLVRADTDALPVEEQTGVPYASTVTTTDDAGRTVPVMHACGHDVHMTVWAGTARWLAENRDQWRGTVVMIAQPAEERSGGAKQMLADGLFERFPTPDYALALHVSAALAAGRVGYCPGYALANVDMVDITVYGEGGHGAYPHTTVDPVVLSAQIINSLQTIVSRSVPPTEAAVVTVGAIHGGNKGNVIPGEVAMQLTLRSYTDAVREHVLDRIGQICEGLARSAGLDSARFPKIDVRPEYTPALYNDPALSERVGQAMARALGEKNVTEVPPVMGGEDFGRYGRTSEQVPILLYWLGAVPPEAVAAADRGEQTLPSLHSPFFAPPPAPTIRTGVRSMTAGVLELLGRQR